MESRGWESGSAEQLDYTIFQLIRVCWFVGTGGSILPALVPRRPFLLRTEREDKVLVTSSTPPLGSWISAMTAAGFAVKKL
jgi:hypothetical protein